MNKTIMYILSAITGIFLILALIFMGKTIVEDQSLGEVPAELNEVTEFPQEAIEEMPSGDDMIDDSSLNIENQNKNMTTQDKTATTPPSTMIDITRSYTAIMETSEGTIILSLNAKDAPNTVNNFVYLSELGFYDDVVFHRIIDGFMIQGGDPLGMGSGGPAYKFEDEIHENNMNNRGTIAMANAGPGTNGSQFFINLVDNNSLDGKHTVFGKVIEGMDVVDKIAKVQTGANDKPVTPVVIKTVTIEVKD